jgi:hypothetical protein
VDWKKLTVIAAAVLLAGYLGARLGGSDQAGQALAGGAANDKLIVVTTDAQGLEGNRLILINAAKQKILVYKLTGNDMGLVTVRGYEFDQELLYTETGRTPGIGFDYPTIKRMVEDARGKTGGGGGDR